MIKLPKWVIPDQFPALYDTESATCIEMTAKIYAAMNTLIDDYNAFVERVNTEIETFENSTDKNYELFTVSIRQEFQDFIDAVELKLQAQDAEIAEAIAYMHTNLEKSLSDIIKSLNETGELNQIILAGLSDVETRLETLDDSVDKNYYTIRIKPDDNLQTILNQDSRSPLRIYIPFGETFTFGAVNITRSNVLFYGGGKLLNTNITMSNDYQTEQICFENITFDFTTEHANKNPIVYHHNKNSFIKNCRFYNCDKSISYSNYNQGTHVSRLTIDNNYFNNVNYALYGDRTGATVILLIGHLHFTNNIVDACKITHVHAEGLDNAIIENNSLLFPNTAQAPGKLHNIYVNECVGVLISNNNLFDAGSDAIYLGKSQLCNITANNIERCGQRMEGSAINMCDGDTNGSVYSINTVTGNTVMRPSGSGISCKKVARGNITGNTIFDSGSKNFYSGTDELSTTSKYAIYVNEECGQMLISDNYTPNNAIVINGNQCVNKANLTSNKTGGLYHIKTKVISMTIPVGQSSVTTNTGYNCNEILGASVIYNEDYQYNPITLLLGDNGSLLISLTGEHTVDRTYQIQISYIENY